MKLLIAVINLVCYATCLLAIVSGAFLAVISIWTEDFELWKGVATAGVLAFAAILVLTANSIIGTKMPSSSGGIIEFVPKKTKAIPSRILVNESLVNKGAQPSVESNDGA